jgi:hypothetical protein
MKIRELLSWAGPRVVAGFASVALIAAPVGTEPCPGVRPGGFLETDGALCTFNFVFKGSDGNTYIGTAGHCYHDTINEVRVWPGDTGPVTSILEGQSDVNAISDPRTPIGHWVFKAFQGNPLTRDELDFGLIRVDPQVEVSAQMCHFGGPTEINAGTSGGSEYVHYYGNGRGFREAPRARTALAPFGFPDTRHVYADGVASPGDSGSGVIDDSGRALGVLVAVGLLYDSTPPGADGDEGHLDIVRLAPQLRLAEKKLGISLRLMTAKPL